MIVKQTHNFAKQKKRRHKNQILALDKAVEAITKNPKIGIQKKADLKSVWVYKFKIHQREYLLAYIFSTKEIILLAIRSHENFYRDLKQSL